jgi:hypothetical protein
MEAKYKYPRTVHLEFSPGASNDDKIIRNMDGFVDEEIVITEKMDGENTTLYSSGLHARSLDSRHHESRDWVKAFHGSIAHDIPYGYRVCGENLFARHSIPYNDLESYFLGFSVWTDDTCLSWEHTTQMFDLIGIKPVREIYRGPYDLGVLVKLAVDVDISKQEGFVARVTRKFHVAEFQSVVAKWVRPGHVVSEDHWMHQPIIPNGLKV